MGTIALENRPDSPTSSSQGLPCMASSIVVPSALFPVPPCDRGVYHKVAAPYFFHIMYDVQLNKVGQSCICWACSPEQ